MAVVSRPIHTSRRASLLGAARRALASGWTSALAYVLLLVLGYALLTPVFSWGQRRMDDLRYGYPRTTQIEGFVGHTEDGGAPTHLMALNLHGQVSVLEIPGGDVSRVRSFEGPYLVGADGRYVVPHLALRDLTGDGQDDLLLQVRDEIVVYVNEGGTFRLMTPAERARLTAAEAEGR
ncbi:MAG TPA: hypothetical protein VNL77_24430 [Roseiflexaceae bacterium]|nr:hypothetical protein [Roseiflexaceae bacterium]